MKKVYDKNDIILYHEDCAKFMKTMSSNSIDMTLTSPPYDNMRKYKGNNTFDTETIAKELFRITKNGGVVIWNVADQTIDGSETGSSMRQALIFMDVGWKLNDTMIYVKENPLPSSGPRYNQAWEYIFCFSKGTPKAFNPIMTRAKYVGYHRYKINKYDDDEEAKYKKSFQLENKKISNVFYYKIGGGLTTKDKVAYEHPAIMHEQLAVDQIRTWSNENDIIFDPFAGSGTTAKACHILRRKFIGTEINEKYCEIFIKRLNENILDDSLFHF